MQPDPTAAQRLAALSAGISNDPIYRMVDAALEECHPSGGVLVDVGCGTGNLRRHVGRRFDRYCGVDVVRYEQLPPDVEFVAADLNNPPVPLPDGAADVVVAVETIEHLENPRAFVRELVRLVKPGGWLLVTTPNQLSWHSKLSLLWRDEFAHFQERPGLYPTHVSALLTIDLVRIARENRLDSIAVRYSGHGRIPLTNRGWPRPLSARSGWQGRAFSDNVLLMARRPGG
jgi:SAM-dependent methyltransferase